MWGAVYEGQKDAEYNGPDRPGLDKLLWSREAGEQCPGDVTLGQRSAYRLHFRSSISSKRQLSDCSAQSGSGRLNLLLGALARKHAAQSVVTKNIVMEQGRKSVQANQEVTHGSHCFVNLLYLLGKILVLRSKRG